MYVVVYQLKCTCNIVQYHVMIEEKGEFIIYKTVVMSNKEYGYIFISNC